MGREGPVACSGLQPGGRGQACVTLRFRRWASGAGAGGLWPRMEDLRPRGVGLASPERDGRERLAVFCGGFTMQRKLGP